jgi:membrane-bound metal-dependent hydrolase YbcI (DUF457 family)
MVPDLEVPFIWVLTGTGDHMVLHSLIGGLTLGTFIAVAITVLLYPPIIGAVFPVNKAKLKEKCVFSAALVGSCAIGVLSHVLLDVMNHAYNPVFWPFLSLYQTPSPIVPLLGGALTASLIMHGAMLVLIAIIFVVNRRGLWDKILVG